MQRRYKTRSLTSLAGNIRPQVRCEWTVRHVLYGTGHLVRPK